MGVDRDDDALLHELGQVLRRLTEPPAEVLAAARGLYDLRELDAELAALTYDSMLDDASTGTRATGGPRILTFVAGELTIEVEVDPSPWARRLLGQLVPAQAAELELRTADGTSLTAATADEWGRFVLGLPSDRQAVRLRVTTTVGEAVDTAPTAI